MPAKALFSKLRKRRIIETLAAFVGGGWLLVEVVERLLVSHYRLPEELIDLTVVSVAGALLATLVWRWFGSGEKRPGNIKIEVLLVPLIILATLAIDLMVVQKTIPIRPKAFLVAVIAVCLGIAWIILKSLQWAAAAPATSSELVHKSSGSSTSTSTRPEKSIAVLPFKNMSADPEQDYFCEGLAEELINVLTRIRDLRIVARTSAFSFQGKDADIREIGKKLNVENVLEGSVRKAGQKLRVTAQLINVADGFHLWSERFDREMSDVFAIQDEISLAIVERMKVALLSGEKAALRKRSTADTEAYHLYLKGSYFMARATPESIRKAQSLFHEALDRDPKFALAHAAMAFTFAGLGALGMASHAELYLKAKAAIENALALDPDLAEAHAVAASLEFFLEWNWRSAEKSFVRVLALNPGDATSRGQYAWLLILLRRFDEATAEIKRALTLDPLMPNLYAWSIGIHALAGRPDEALADFSRLRQIEPNFGLAYFHAAVAYYRKGLFDEAIETLEKGRNLIVFPGWKEHMLLFCYLRKGDRGRAERIMTGMLEERKRLPVSPVNLAFSSAALGDLEGALEWLETAIRERDALITILNVAAEFLVPDLASDPRFETILDRLQLPHDRGRLK